MDPCQSDSNRVLFAQWALRVDTRNVSCDGVKPWCPLLERVLCPPVLDPVTATEGATVCRVTPYSTARSELCEESSNLGLTDSIRVNGEEPIPEKFCFVRIFTSPNPQSGLRFSLSLSLWNANELHADFRTPVRILPKKPKVRG